LGIWGFPNAENFNYFLYPGNLEIWGFPNAENFNYFLYPGIWKFGDSQMLKILKK
jgi:hypothetical protein